MVSIAGGIFGSSSWSARFCSSVASSFHVNSTTCRNIALPFCLPRGRSALGASLASEGGPRRRGHRNGAWGRVVPEARRLAPCGVRPRRLLRCGGRGFSRWSESAPGDHERWVGEHRAYVAEHGRTQVAVHDPVVERQRERGHLAHG